VLSELTKLGFVGPLMVSTGTPEKLVKFLELNPTVPRDRIFVDDSENYDSYKALKFRKLGGDSPPPSGVKFKVPNLDMGTWFNYMKNVISLAPIREKEDGVPEGVTLLGGTVVFSGERMLFASADGIPGDYPPPMDVLDKVKAQL